MAMNDDPDLARVPGYRHVRARVTNGPPEVTAGMWRIREWRRQAGLTQEQAGRLLGISNQRVCVYETGRAAVPFRVLLAIAVLSQPADAQPAAREPLA
ncbi:helix-turn-helix domain-containing protein [Micromonospora aurantiaca (nom. illeg.)]|uniref:helix-turn-helix domain-containing protein n=1 Tax=Micromonospora aurantiaca (nom. illeg.) TaxID=47850 RepID=UPI001656C8E6|nr:helix-turn-helix transcriptional regulator [Micromonospora aurantiaca]MBC9001274.1 helix-turn-helix transcriptional regulator [Micromonospora aurantiaca]